VASELDGLRDRTALLTGLLEQGSAAGDQVVYRELVMLSTRERPASYMTSCSPVLLFWWGFVICCTTLFLASLWRVLVVCVPRLVFESDFLLVDQFATFLFVFSSLSMFLVDVCFLMFGFCCCVFLCGLE
jgi:hypothetical protein